jgi:hypothetical protein
MNTGMGCLSVSLNLSGRESGQRLEVCTAAFHEAELGRIDEIRLEPGFMERPPPDVEAAVQALLQAKAARWGRVKIRGPSQCYRDQLASLSVPEVGRLVHGGPYARWRGRCRGYYRLHRQVRPLASGATAANTGFGKRTSRSDR